MAEIVEVPIEGLEITESVEAPVEVATEAPIKKKRGRPAGSFNKPKAVVVPAPNAKSKKVRAPTPEESEEEEQPPPRKRRAPRREPEDSVDSVSPPPDTRAIAAEVISLLSNRNVDRAAAKRDKYRGWFQQP